MLQHRGANPLVVLAWLSVVLASCQPAHEPPRATGVSTDEQVKTLIAEGRRLWGTRKAHNLRASLDRFQQATALNQDSAEAWAGVADASALIGLYALAPPQQTMPRALEAAQRALDLDPSIGRTWASLALAQYLFQWDFSAAHNSFERALALDPDNHDAHHWMAMMLSVTGHHQQALEHIEAAAELMPSSPLLATKVGTILAAAGRLALAERALRSAHERFPEYPLPSRELGFLALRQWHFEAAASAFQASLENSDPEIDWRREGNPKALAALAHALGRQSRDGREQRTEAWAEAQNLLDTLQARRKVEYIPSMVIAYALVGLGRHDEALAELNRAITERDPGLVYLYTKPGFELLPAERLDVIANGVGGLAPFAEKDS